MNILIKKFRKWNNIKKCYYCKSTKIEMTNNHYHGFGLIVEYDVVCSNCGKLLNHFEYGDMQYPETKTGELKYLWHHNHFQGIKQLWKDIKYSIRILFL